MELSKERMLEISETKETCDFCPYLGDDESCVSCREVNTVPAWELVRYYEQLKKLLQSDVEGRLVMLPCNIGDTVYEIYRFCGDGAWEIDEHKITLEDIDKIGKTVFSTREEAEDALRM